MSHSPHQTTPHISAARRWKIRLLEVLWEGKDLEELRVAVGVTPERVDILRRDVQDLQDMGVVEVMMIRNKMRFVSLKRSGIAWPEGE